MPKLITGVDVAAALYAELNAGDWGDIDPEWAAPADERGEGRDADDHRAFQALLGRVAQRLNNVAGA